MTPALSGDTGFLIGLRADGNVEGIILPLELLKAHILAHADAGMDLNAQGEDGLDLLIQLLPGQAVAGDAVAHHAAQALPLFVDRDLVAHESQVVSGGKASGAAADDSHLLPRGVGAVRLGHVPGLIHGVALQGPDIQGIVYHVAAAAGLAGMLTDVGAGDGKGIVLADEAHRVGAALLLHQGDVAGDVHPCGTQGHAGHGVSQVAEAAVVEDVLLIILPEALEAHQDHVGGIDADGAVRRVGDGLRRLLDVGEDAEIRLPFQHLLQHIGQLRESDAAGHAFSAGLGPAEIQKVQRQIHRAKTRRTCGNPLLHVPVELLHGGIRLTGSLYLQSAQCHPSFLVLEAAPPPRRTPKLKTRCGYCSAFSPDFQVFLYIFHKASPVNLLTICLC